MIGSLRGKVLERSVDTTVLLEVSGVGYLVQVTPRTLAELEPTTNAFLHIHQHIREDSNMLFGFATRAERDTFHVLISTHGIGPSLALAILGVHSPAALVDIIASADVGGLTIVPGVGKKTAERLLIELKNKLDLPILQPIQSGDADGPTSAVADVREALLSLGYGLDEIREALRHVSMEHDPSEMLRQALSALGTSHA